MKCTPIIYGTSLVRSIMMKPILESTFHGVQENIVNEYSRTMGIQLTISDYTLKMRDEWLILLGCGIIFLVLGMCLLKYSKKADR